MHVEQMKVPSCQDLRLDCQDALADTGLGAVIFEAIKAIGAEAEGTFSCN